LAFPEVPQYAVNLAIVAQHNSVKRPGVYDHLTDATALGRFTMRQVTRVAFCHEWRLQSREHQGDVCKYVALV